MKKNLMMRAASVLLVAVMLTTCAISGTFAKYVTSDSNEDSARVAKFGVEVLASGSLFDAQYDAVGAGNKGVTFTAADAGTVNGGAANQKVVAPGTVNNDSMTFSITGIPEVAVSVDIEFTVTSDIFLAENFLTDVTTGDADIYENDADYYPVKYTLVHTPATGAPVTTVGNLAAIENYLENTINGGVDEFAPNTNLANTFGSFELTWAWDYNVNDKADKNDTVLGDLAATTPTVLAYTSTHDDILSGTALTAGMGEDYSLNTDFDFVITVTQID